MAKPNIAFIETSLDDGSFEAKLANTAIKAIGDRAEVIPIDYADLPMLNAGTDEPDPAAALAIRDKLDAADGVWVFVSEYHKTIPDSVRNLFQWVSMPDTKNPETGENVLHNMPACITGVGGSKGMVPRALLGDLLEANGMYVFPIEVGLSVPEEAFQTNDWVMNEADEGAITMQANDFLNFIQENPIDRK